MGCWLLGCAVFYWVNIAGAETRRPSLDHSCFREIQLAAVLILVAYPAGFNVNVITKPFDLAWETFG